MTSTKLNLPALNTESGLSRYFREAWTYPVLDAQEEIMLAERYRKQGDVEAAHKLVTSHLRLVAKIAMGYRGYGLPVADLVSEGNIGLMKAVKKFDPERGFRLSTYAMWWIRAAITEYVLRSWSMVKMGTVAAQKKLFFSLRKHKKALGIVDSGELDDDQATTLSDALDISKGDIVNMNRRMASRDLSLNAPVADEDGQEFQDNLVSEELSPETLAAEGEESALRGQLLARAVENLNERERHIFIERRLKDDPVTLEELGQHYGISRERVRQLEVRAFDKVKKAVVEAMPVSLGGDDFTAVSAPA
ncbi:RNA polymerase sigma factor RpoH [Varunaivibrio sulfuroxidans]|uniref:RNA polymerase sigma factor n=1 Tax=Varunaivibrio sulfuroxidans TaxID=1773489 RepID=A0A4R3J7I4_9PROT|nr:RNA polymerase sigma factor RpoH [Varunaivibrio sulfuroxidans]TCS61354.1 RNA polymerase RpoH-like sigma 32 subunit [Varunaivibrio sulfuroxidans]WES31033.1 RNA polymerase sigma factor RpoH [Varunaivibrio sulfuroxidans]